MKSAAFILTALLATAVPAADLPDNLVAEGIPSISEELKADVGRYLDFRLAGFQDWHPERRAVLLTTRFADVNQLHVVEQPNGARQQLTFGAERVLGGEFMPLDGNSVVFVRDVGGGEFYQLYRLGLNDGRVTLLTDGKSRNSGPTWAHDGSRFAYTSTRRNGRDADIHLMNPEEPASNRLLLEVNGGGWRVTDWSHDGRQLLVQEYISINESRLHLVNVGDGERRELRLAPAGRYAIGQARFAPDDSAVYVSTDALPADAELADGGFRRLARLDLRTGKLTLLTGHIRWNVETFEISPDGKQVALVMNEDGISVLRVINARNGREQRLPKIPAGVIGGLKWHRKLPEIGFSLSSARSPTDVYSVDLRRRALTRWTASETGGLNPETFAEPELIRIESFDGLVVSGFVYRPDAAKFPGPRPVMMIIHGGPEAQSRPSFLARNNYLLNELGIALVVPNVRGSDGYGTEFLDLDNGFKREDSVKDIGAFLDWIERQPDLDAGRVAVYGGSYGGYMVLASMVHYNDRLRCGIDVVGISNFVTFLKNTQDYRRDLRRVEYGDERDPAMLEFLERISPNRQADKIKKPLFVIQGFNDPRVPVTESEQMVKAIREAGGDVWYLMARDEGHGFAKKPNADFQFYAMIEFLRRHLL